MAQACLWKGNQGLPAPMGNCKCAGPAWGEYGPAPSLGPVVTSLLGKSALSLPALVILAEVSRQQATEELWEGSCGKTMELRVQQHKT